MTHPPRDRPSIQLKSLVPNQSLRAQLNLHHTILFYSCERDGALTKASDEARSLVRKLGVDAHEIEVANGSALKEELQSYSGWRYFPQLYVAAEFIGGNIVLHEFFASHEYERILESMRVPVALNDVRDRIGQKGSRLAAVWRISASPDETHIIVSRADGSIEIVRACDRISCLRVSSHNGWVNSARFSATGDQFYSGGSDTILKVWTAESGSIIRALPAHSRWINDIAVDPKARYVASVGADRKIRFWSPTTLALLSENSTHHSNIWCAFASDDELITGDESGSVVITNVRDFNSSFHFLAHENGLTSISWTTMPGGFCTTGFDGMVYGWNSQGKRLFEYGRHLERVWCACPMLDLGLMATASADGAVDIWNPITSHQAQRFNYAASPLGLCYLRRERALVVGLSDGTLVWVDL